MSVVNQFKMIAVFQYFAFNLTLFVFKMILSNSQQCIINCRNKELKTASLFLKALLLKSNGVSIELFLLVAPVHLKQTEIIQFL